MRAAVPAEGADLDAAPSAVFGRSPWVLLVAVETGAVTARPGGANDVPSGAGVRAAQAVVDAGADVLLAARIGPNAHEVLEGNGVRVLAVEGTTVREAVERLRAGTLRPLAVARPMHPRGAG